MSSATNVQDPPGRFICPVSFSVMTTPVRLVATGKVYEEGSISDWFSLGKKTCPATGQELSTLDYEVVFDLKKEIEEWIEKTGFVEDVLVEVPPPRPVQAQQRRELMKAAKFGCLGEIQRLKTEQNIDLNVLDSQYHNYTALHWASQEGHLAVVNFLIDEGLDIDQTDDDGLTPLHLATFYGKTKVAEQLLVKGANPNCQDKSGGTPLHMAGRKGRTSIVLSLLEAGADQYIKDKAGDTPRDKAGLWGRLFIRRLLK